MPYTGDDVIREAREKHRAFTEAQSPKRSALRALNRVMRRWWYDSHERDSDLYVATQIITFPLANFDAGEPLTEPDSIPIGGQVHIRDSNIIDTLTIVPFKNRLAPGQGPAAYIASGVIRFVGQVDDWQRAEKVEYYYAPEPVPLTVETDPVYLPEAARESLVDAVAVWMSNRGGMDQKLTVTVQATMRSDLTESKDRWLAEVGRMGRGKTYIVREAW